MTLASIDQALGQYIVFDGIPSGFLDKENDMLSSTYNYSKKGK